MKLHIWSHENLKSIVSIGNYSPRRCGIATFTSDLLGAIQEEATDTNCWAIAMNDTPEGYHYPERVRFEINQHQLSDYKLAAEFLNMNKIDIVNLQHEYGIFGGIAGSNIIRLISDLRMPVVTTLHTVLKKPTPEQKEALGKVIKLSSRIVVMSKKAISILKELYSIPEEKIVFIPHGIPDSPYIDPNYYKDQFGVEGKNVILTFGFISQNKGLEYAIKALPEIIKKHKDVVYIILGATHPHVLKTQGEEYRISLQQLAEKLGVSEHVIFQNRFVELNELCEFLGIADIYITPYINEDQIVSGTLAYAMGTGKATISTPYWYANEMLADGRGCIVPFKNANAIAKRVIDLLDNPVKRHAIRKKAYTFCRDAVWKEVARSYLKLFIEVKKERAFHPCPVFVKKTTVQGSSLELPEVKLDHLRYLTDDTGILQHSIFTIPNRVHGYCTDDNARALIFTSMVRNFIVSDEELILDLYTKYLSFLQYAFNEKTDRFRNFMSYDRRWLDEVGSEDSHGRAIWGLGVAVAYSENQGHLEMSVSLFNKSIKAIENFTSPRAWAFALVGIHAYLRKFFGDREIKRIREVIANKLFGLFQRNMSNDWQWVEDKLSYANGKLPHALLLSGQWLQRGDMIDMGLKVLEWLNNIQLNDGYFVPIGNDGWYSKGGNRARFDQQPIEAQAMIDACIEAYYVTKDRKWIDIGITCFKWFLGKNDLNAPLYDPRTGGCRDGLMPNGANQNEGAESTLAWLLSLSALHKLYTEQILVENTNLEIK